MNKLLMSFKSEAQALAARQELPAFYRSCAPELQFSRETFFDHPLICRLQEDVLPFLYDDYGHGIDHSKKVAIEASAILLVEARTWSMDVIRHLAFLAQVSGLLHDICRIEPEHACRGAEMARIILHDYPLSDRDKAMIAFSIGNHEAFRPTSETGDPEEQLLAAALYDADKFRWGPDNFVTTLWEFCDYEEWPLEDILARFPQGLDRIKSVASTFRTQTGQTYGPEMIELGLSLGRQLHLQLQNHCQKASPDRAHG